MITSTFATSGPVLGGRAPSRREVDFRRLDIVDRRALDAAIGEVQPASIFHLAAKSSMTVSVSDPGRDCAVNVKGTLNVVEAAGRHQSPVVITSTGGALYGNDAPIPTPEDQIPAPLAPNGASKTAEAYTGRGPRPPASLMRSAGWGTRTDRVKARTVRRVWCRSSLTTSTWA